VGKRILVVEGEEDIREFVQAALEMEGHQVETSHTDLSFQNGHNQVPDLILLDVMITREVGLEFFRQWKMREPTKAIPLILFSAHVTVSQALHQSHVPILSVTPCYIRELLDTVRKSTRAI
jgi:DNA-binding response OmpR family regulator